MKKVNLTLISILLTFVLCQAHSGDTITVPFGDLITLNGITDAGEWDDAVSVYVAAVSGSVYIKHNSTYLFLQFQSGNPSYQSTGIYVDKNNDGATAPQSDDVWIHGSMGPYEWYGNGTDWESSIVAGWDYQIDQVNEYAIELQKLDINPNVPDTLGVLFSFLDWSTSESTWPSGGNAILDNPSAWADMIFQASPTQVETPQIADTYFEVFPNPCKDMLVISSPSGIGEDLNYILMNAAGQQITHEYSMDLNNLKLDITNLEPGVYFISIYQGNTTFRKKILKL